MVNNILGRSDSQAGGGFGGAAGGGFGGVGGQATALPVVTAEVVRETVSNFLVATTTLTAERSIDVVSRAGGPVTEVLVQEGDAVRAGQLLAQLEQDAVRLSLAEAQAHYDNIAREFDRTTELAKRNAVSNQELDNQRYQLELRSIALERTRQQLADTEIRSPLAGIIGERLIEPGATISSNTRVFKVLDPDPLLAVMHIPDSGRRSLIPGQQVQVLAAGDVQAAGFIARISPVVDAESGTVKVTVELDSAGVESGALVPGTFVTVQVPTETRPDALVVPRRAVLLERDQSIVFRVEEGVAVRTPVAVGLSARDLVEITSGLTAGAVVVTVGQESLRDGTAVRQAGEPLPETAAGGAGGRGAGGGGGGGFSLAQIPAERRQVMVERLLANPQVKEAYDAKLKEDPALENDEEKRLAFFQEQLEAIGGPGALFGGGAGAAGGGRQGGAAGAAAAAGGGAGGAAGAGGQTAASDQGQAAAGAGAQRGAGGGQAAAGGGADTGGQVAASGRGQAAAGGGAGGFSLAQIPAERRQVMVERLLANPQVKEAYDAKLKEDPSLENDEEKRLAFFQEQLEAIGGPRALFGGGGGG